MSQATGPASDQGAVMGAAPTVFPASPKLDDCVDRFWDVGPEFDDVVVRVEPVERSLAILERLGPSPFERGGFPLIGFLATTYDKLSRYAVRRG